MLETVGYSGLQRQTVEGTWLDVEYLKGSLIVNIGLLLSNISGVLIKATRHRMVDCGAERYGSALKLTNIIKPMFCKLILWRLIF
jgi:isopenicillin N synthase-like dioxygenase